MDARTNAREKIDHSFGDKLKKGRKWQFDFFVRNFFCEFLRNFLFEMAFFGNFFEISSKTKSNLNCLFGISFRNFFEIVSSKFLFRNGLCGWTLFDISLKQSNLNCFFSLKPERDPRRNPFERSNFILDLVSFETVRWVQRLFLSDSRTSQVSKLASNLRGKAKKIKDLFPPFFSCN